MKTFLQYIAQDLASRFPNQLQQVVMVFPNKRAGLFMNEFLAQTSDKPIWAPTYVSITELFRQFSDNIKVPDKIQLVCELYPIYLKLRHQTEQELPLDSFYSWGEMLLADFDDTDKNMVPVHQLFQNLKDLKEMDTTEFLSEEQKEALGIFFDSFKFQDTDIQQEFIRVWDILEELYLQYKEHLQRKNLLYEGALFRKIVEELNPEDLTAPCYVFVGFNVLNKVEETLFQKVKDAGKALFYWDYDNYYTESPWGDMEAGHFLKRNMEKFGNSLPIDCFKSMELPKKVEIIAAATENAQVSHITPWLKQNLTEKESETAVVLCNEALLEPVLHVLPEDVKSLNITMGFPLASTPIYSFIKALCELQLEGFSEEKCCYRYEQVRNVLMHPYAHLVSENADALMKELTSNNIFLPAAITLGKDDNLSQLFPAQPLTQDIAALLNYLGNQISLIAKRLNGEENNGQSTFTPLYREAFFTAYTLLNRLNKLVEDKILNVQAKTLTRFIDQLMGGAAIPFHGEPIIGLQVMGVLETRCLDFKHLVLLSLNEGMLPKNESNSSFIPYNLRKAFGMTLIEQKIAVYAYYFYRLIQRAEKVTFVYNNNTEGLQKGEMSRFLLQYLIEHPSNHEVKNITLTTEQKPIVTEGITVDKTDEMMRKLIARYQSPKKYMSPTAFNTYLDCPLKFYFKYVAQIKTPDEVNMEIDNATFGNIFHHCAERIYCELTNNRRQGLIVQSMLEDLLKDEVKLRQIVDDAMKKDVFNIQDPSEPLPTLNGIQTIVQRVMLQYIKQLIRRDIKLAPFTIMGLEKEIKDKFYFQFQGQDAWIQIGGNIDRTDVYMDAELNKEILRIIDYKTSGSPQSPGTLEELFNKPEKRPYHALQAFYYAMQVPHCEGLNPRNHPVSPALFYIQKAAGDDYKPAIEIKEDAATRNNKHAVMDFETQIGMNFRELVKENLENLFDKEKPFCQGDVSHCEYCDYNNICRR